MVAKARLALLLFLAFAALQLGSGMKVVQAASPDVIPYCITASVPGPYTIQQCINYSLPYIAIGLLFSFQVVAVCYLVGEVLGSGAFKGWYQNELWESAKSLLLAGAIIGIILLAGVLASTVSGSYLKQYSTTGSGGSVAYCGTTSTASVTVTGNVSNVYVVACNYLAGEVIEANTSYYTLLGTMIGAMYLESLDVTWYTPILSQIPIPTPIGIIGSVNFGTNVNFFQSDILSFNPLESNFMLDLFNLLIYPMLLVINAQYYLMLTFIGVGLGVLLPLGLILRAIPFLRMIGGNFIALAISVAIVYPCLLVFFNLPVTLFFQGATTYVQSQVFAGAGPLSGFGIIWTAIESILVGVTNPAYFAVQLQVLKASQFSVAGFQAGDYTGMGAFVPGGIIPLMDALMGYTIIPLLVQFVLFVIDLILVVAITQNVAALLGGEIRLGIGKMKLA